MLGAKVMLNSEGEGREEVIARRWQRVRVREERPETWRVERAAVAAVAAASIADMVVVASGGFWRCCDTFWRGFGEKIKGIADQVS